MTARLTSRRAALGAFAATAALPAGIGLANHGAGAASPDAALLAIAPKLLPLLERADAMGVEISRLYDEADAERQRAWHDAGQRQGWKVGQARFTQVCERNGYFRRFDARSVLLEEAEKIIEPFLSHIPQTLDGLLLKARYAASMDMEWIPQEDIAALLKQRWGVVKGGEA